MNEPSPPSSPLGLLVLGASGGCGAHVVRQAVARGHRVTAIVREGTRYEAPEGARVVRDDVLRDGALADAIEPDVTIISCRGIKRTVARNPWSRLVSPPDFSERIATALAPVMRAKRARRLLLVSAAGVAESAPAMSFPMRFVFDHSNIGVAYRDLARAEAAYRESGVEWLACRPVTLTDGAGGTPVREVSTFGLAATIARSDVARWLLDRAEDARPLGGATPMIAN